jgi:membrane-associated protease RseP (regulator of RpoE activity)
LREYFVHLSLLLVTFLTVTLAGVQWANRDPFELGNFSDGIDYSLLLLLVLGSHEAGHYVASWRNGAVASLPYFLPFPPLPGMLHFGTLGAVIKLRSQIRTSSQIFDVGAAGPIAGFVVSLALLAIGFSTLPPIEFLYSFHPEYAQQGSIPTGGPAFGQTIIFSIMAWLFASPGAFVPPMNEVYHYPLLCVGWFGLFVTAMNLIPVGQLDGGHIAFAMFGRKARTVGLVSLSLLFLLGVGEFTPLIGLPFGWGWSGWLVWAFLLLTFTRGMKNRTDMPDSVPLSPTRRYIGWLCFTILVVSFSPSPFSLSLE